MCVCVCAVLEWCVGILCFFCVICVVCVGDVFCKVYVWCLCSVYGGYVWCVCMIYMRCACGVYVMHGLFVCTAHSLCSVWFCVVCVD